MRGIVGIGVGATLSFDMWLRRRAFSRAKASALRFASFNSSSALLRSSSNSSSALLLPTPLQLFSSLVFLGSVALEVVAAQRGVMRHLQENRQDQSQRKGVASLTVEDLSSQVLLYIQGILKSMTNVGSDEDLTSSCRSCLNKKKKTVLETNFV